MSDQPLLTIENDAPTALATFEGVTRWAIYRTSNIWVGAPKFSPDKQDVVAQVMFPDPSEPGQETGMWFGMSVRELLADEFWTLVMRAQHSLEALRDQYADWSKISHEPILLPRSMWTEEKRNAQQ